MNIQDIPTTSPLSEVTLRIVYSPTSAPRTTMLPTISTPPMSSASAVKRRVVVSGPQRLQSSVAIELGDHLRDCGFFNYAGEAALVDSSGQSLDVLTPERFRSVIEKHVTPVRTTDIANGDEQTQSITINEAKDILNSELFLERLPLVDHFNSVQLPVFVGNHAKLELLREAMMQPIKCSPQILVSPTPPRFHWTTRRSF